VSKEQVLSPTPGLGLDAGMPQALRVRNSLAGVELDAFSLQDVEAIRLLLRGGSVVDWRRASFADLAEVEDFIRVSGLDPNRAKDRVRLHTLHRQALVYLKESLHFSFPDDLAQPESVSSVFLEASAAGGRRQQLACSLLKVMHIINHIEARELRHRLSIPDQELFERVAERVVDTVEELQGRGIPVSEFLPSVKEKSSVITKLLSKRRTQAAQIFDRIRFRIITERPEDILPTLRHLTRRLFPFNYVTPEESRNDVLDFRAALERVPRLHDLSSELQFPLQVEDRSHTGISFNEFSAHNYRSISFVTDVPLRVDAFMPPESRLFEEFGPLVYVTTEFQMFDQATAVRNEQGEGSHGEYKRRQLNRVQYRLTHGSGPGSGGFR